MKLDVIPLNGGLDLVTTPVLLKPGQLISAQNFEPDINGGYRRMAGFERFDGRARPHKGDYHVMGITTTGSFAVGNTVTGATSGATSVILEVTSSTQLVVTKLVGTYILDEVLNVSGSPQGTFKSIAINGASTGILHAKYKNLAADNYRADITAVPGSGAVRGVWYYNGDVYALRDNAAATQCILHKATTSGWTAITFGREIQFQNAVGEIFEGNTVTGLVSGASAVVRRALLRTGTWTSSGVGTLVFDSVTGAFTSGEALQVGGITKATSTTADTAITLQPGGKFEFDNINFFGSVDKLRMYCADGVNFLGEFDGTRWVPIRTGIGDDKPKFVKGHKNHLFTSFKSTLQHSGIASPYSWTALTGAAELSLGENVTGILPQTGDATVGVLVATTKTKTFILYGNSSADWKLITHSPDTGAKEYTMQNIGSAHFLDTRGVTQLRAVQSFGSFELSVLTRLVQPIIDEKRGLEVASTVVRSTNQYRVFYSDGSGIILYLVPVEGGTTSAAAMYFNYSTFLTVNTVISITDISGIERIFAAGTNGFVYELDVGTSFDGAAIEAYFFTVFNHSKSVRQRKRYRRTILQFKAGNTARLSIGYDLSYGNQDPSYGSAVSRSAVIAKTTQGAGGSWDSFNWDSFVWDASYAQDINMNTPGTGESFAILVSGETDEDEPYTIHTIIPHFILGRQER